MKKVRIAHMADFHIGGVINEKNILSEEINKNLITALVNIVKVLNLSKVQILLIAGDFYETSSIDGKLLDNVKEILSQFNGKIVISPGNHDYVSLESVYCGKWPENTYIFLEEKISYIEFSELKTRVYGFAFNQSHIQTPMISNISNIDDQYINIGVFHGQIDSKLNEYHPIFLNDIKNSNLEYIALGHVHKKSEIKQEGKTYYAYSGNPMGRGFDETGEKGLYLGDISKYTNSLNFYKFDNSQFEIVKIEITNFESQIIIANQIREHLRNIFGLNFKKNYYRIILTGYIKHDENINLEIIQSYLSDLRYSEILDDSRLYIDKEELRNQENIKGKFIDSVLNSNLSECEKEDIINYGIKAFEGLL